MNGLTLFKSVKDEINQTPDEKEVSGWALPIRRSLSTLCNDVIFIDTEEKAEALLIDLNRYVLGAIAIDTEFGFSRPELHLKKNKTWNDIRSQVPLLLSGAAWVPQSNSVIRFVFDLTKPELKPWLEELFYIQTVFVGHYLKAEFFTLWSLGVEPMLHQTYDTWVAAKLLSLGQNNKTVEVGFWNDEAQYGEEDDPKFLGHSSLLGQCEIYNIKHRYLKSKDVIAKSFLDHAPNSQFSYQQIDYASADAEATLELYLAQQTDVISHGLLPHLNRVEFPFVEANARMEWVGVNVDQHQTEKLLEGLGRSIKHYKSKLRAVGLDNPNSPTQAVEWLEKQGYGERILYKGKRSSRDEVLVRIEELDPKVRDLRRYRKYSKLSKDALFNSDIIGADGRVHPNHRHLGADTTRNSCSVPNIPGVSKTFRPVVTAPEGRAVIELDYSQIEVGICAAVYHDQKLVDAFNSGDVYAAVAQQFYAEQLCEEDRRCSVEEFKQRHPDLRNKVKVFVLAVLYNMQAKAISELLGISESDAKNKREEFLACYPSMKKYSQRSVFNGKKSGFAPITGGIRRQVAAGWKAKNQFINTPVQGSAAVAFRNAVVKLDRHFRGTITNLILPVHDAVVIECDEGDVKTVGKEASMIMVDAVREYFPQLHPRVDINDEDPSCWNKDGKSNSIDEFIENPEFKLE